MLRKKLISELANEVLDLKTRHPIRVGISGITSSGKTTLANELTEDAARVDESWAWAHVQVSSDEGTEGVSIQDLVAQQPERRVARLLCPRRLDAGTTYSVMLRAGVRGRTSRRAPAAASWNAEPARACVDRRFRARRCHARAAGLLPLALRDRAGWRLRFARARAPSPARWPTRWAPGRSI